MEVTCSLIFHLGGNQIVLAYWLKYCFVKRICEMGLESWNKEFFLKSILFKKWCLHQILPLRPQETLGKRRRYENQGMEDTMESKHSRDYVQMSSQRLTACIEHAWICFKYAPRTERTNGHMPSSLAHKLPLFSKRMSAAKQTILKDRPHDQH